MKTAVFKAVEFQMNERKARRMLSEPVVRNGPFQANDNRLCRAAPKIYRIFLPLNKEESLTSPTLLAHLLGMAPG